MNKIQLFAMLLFFCSIVACKKEEVNNPDIEDVMLGFSIENTDPTGIVTKEMFIEREALPDFYFNISHPDFDPNQHHVYMSVADGKYEFLNQVTPTALYRVKTKEKNEFIRPSDTEWYNEEPLYLYIKEKDPDGNLHEYGNSDTGDQYIAFRKNNSGGGYFYGWMKINITSGVKLEIKEYALHKIADTPIKAGEK